MHSFAIIAEGKTDQWVIENVLHGVYGEVRVSYVQPKPHQFGGWGLVLDSLGQGEFEEALDVNDFLVIQIDTDVRHLAGFDVNRSQPTLASLVVAVRYRLIEAMGPAFETYEHRIFFAVAVHSTECWLLPLLQPRRPKTPKTMNCEHAANSLLRKAGRRPLGKKPDRYRDESAPYRKSKILQSKGRQDPSLAAFLDSLPAE